jgi:hypothetical protein
MGKLSREEQETVISWDESDNNAIIYTCEKRWIKHLENKLGLKPIMDNGCGGKEYQLPKKKILMPRPDRKLTTKQRQSLVERGKRLANHKKTKRLSSTE